MAFNNIYKDKTVLITGHAGFKGSWLAFWLKNMGAKVEMLCRQIDDAGDRYRLCK